MPCEATNSSMQSKVSQPTETSSSSQMDQESPALKPRFMPFLNFATQKKRYSMISEETRQKFIKRVMSKEVTIKEVNKNLY